MFSVLVLLTMSSLEKSLCSTLNDLTCSPFWLASKGFSEVAEVFNFILGRGPKIKLTCL